MRSNDEVLNTFPHDDQLAGRTAVVTGATSGIGEAIAHVLASSGAEVVVAGRDAGRAARVVDAIAGHGGKAHVLTVDLAAGPDAVRAFARAATELLGGRVDILVNNAGVFPVGPTAEFPDGDLAAILSTNIEAPHVLVGALAPAMAERGSGWVVNIGSWMARVGVPFGAAYTASKAAIEQMTRTWAAEYGPRGVRVNTVAPGLTATPGNAEAAETLAQMARATVAGVPVRPVDIAYAVRFAVSDQAVYLQGGILDVDGGLLGARLG